MRTTEWFPSKPADYDDEIPSLAEASADERALRRRQPIPREPVPDGVVDLVAALERATGIVQAEYRNRRR